MGLHKGQTNAGSFKKGQTAWNKDLTKEININVKKISETRKRKLASGEIKNNPNKFIIGHKQLNTGKTHFKIGQNTGEQHHNWQGGKSFEPYSIKWKNSLKKFIRDRDNFQCKICYKKQENRKLDVHHIDYDKKNCNEENLISLCITCHRKTNFNRKKWIKYFKQKMECKK